MNRVLPTHPSPTIKTSLVHQSMDHQNLHSLSLSYLSLLLGFVAMAQGRGSATHAVTIAVALLVFLVHSEIAHAATFTVGGPGGWSFNIVGWPKGKRFRAGDVLVFKYNPAIHNVVAVDGRSYNACRTPRGARVYKSGNDQIRLAKGPNSFICNFPGHCESGMKITVNAA